MPFPFEVPFDQIEADPDTFVDEVFATLSSDFLTMPRGKGFVEQRMAREWGSGLAL
jgi:hypothetical protein